MTHLWAKDYFDDTLPLTVLEVPQGASGPHSHEFFELVYVRRGRGIHVIGSAHYPIQAGDVYVISPGEPHAYHPRAGEAMRIVNLLFQPDVLDRSLASGAALAGLTRLLYVEPLFREEARFTHRLHVTGTPAYAVETLLDDMLREQEARASGYAFVLTHLFCILLVMLSRAYEGQIAREGAEPEFSRRHAVVAAAVRYIEAHYDEPVSVSDVARHTALSPSRLAHLFKEHTHRSILTYLHEYRINRICADLLRTDAPVTDLAAAQGYGDLRFFYRVFRRQVGLSPTAYRRLFTPRQTPP